ncbi:MAG: YceH family protein [Thermoanaerobaculia bacterium]|nr:YceH family protein [Thermoanaerobaculia bacterium]
MRELDPTEIRILGALLEKEQATPDYYPLTVATLIAACNQKSNRDPVTSLEETEIVETLDRLRLDALAWRHEGARAERWSQMISRRLELDSAEKAALTVLMLRGPQTVGELRTRTHRLREFADLAEVEAALERMADDERRLVEKLPRRPGQKEPRWAHRLGPGPEPREETPVSQPAPRRAPAPRRDERLERIEERLEALEALVERLRRDLGE